MIWIAIPAALFLYLYLREPQRSIKRTIAKCLPSLLAFIVGLYNLLFGKAFPAPELQGVLLVSALLICTVADAVLEYSFIPGTALFACAHACLIAAFALCGTDALSSIAVFAMLFALYLFALQKLKKKKPAQIPFSVLVAYAFVLSLMVALACACNGYLIAGAIMFMLSDTVLGLRLFQVMNGKWTHRLIMTTYYTALYLFAFGFFI